MSEIPDAEKRRRWPEATRAAYRRQQPSQPPSGTALNTDVHVCVSVFWPPRVSVASWSVLPRLVAA